MAKGGKIPVPVLASVGIPIPEQGAFLQSSPFFSLKYYAHEHRKFSIKAIEKEEVDKLFLSLRDHCKLKWREIQNGDFHFHEVIWAKTAYPQGFENLPAKFRDKVTPWQFKAFEKFRIFGFFDRDVFCIVWFDKDHEVCPERN